MGYPPVIINSVIAVTEQAIKRAVLFKGLSLLSFHLTARISYVWDKHHFGIQICKLNIVED